MNSSTVQCFVLIIVSLCVCSWTVQQFNSYSFSCVLLWTVLCIDNGVSLCVLWTVQQCFVLIIVSLCVCYEQFNSSVFCIDYSFSLCVCYEQFNSSVFCIDYSFSLCVMNVLSWTVQQFSVFVLTIVSLCVCVNSSTVRRFVLTIVYLCVCYEQFNILVFCIDYSFSLCVLWTVQQFSALYWL